MSIEQQVQNLIDGAVDELTVPELHELLVRAAEISGGKPRAATGPGTQFIWRLGNRGQTIRVGRFRGGKLSLSHETFDWAERGDQEYRDFKWGEVPNLPYLRHGVRASAEDGLRARFGGQQAQFASLTTGSFAWQVGSVGLVLELDAKRVALVVVADGNRAVSLVQALSQPPT